MDLDKQLDHLVNVADNFKHHYEIMRTFKSPENGKPFSDDGLEEMAKQLLSAGKLADSCLHEMAGLAIRRLLSERERNAALVEAAKEVLNPHRYNEKSLDRLRDALEGEGDHDNQGTA